MVQLGVYLLESCKRISKRGVAGVDRSAVSARISPISVGNATERLVGRLDVAVERLEQLSCLCSGLRRNRDSDHPLARLAVDDARAVVGRGGSLAGRPDPPHRLPR